MTNLPPLTEKIDKGAAGGHEFERLMHRLLLRDGQRNGYLYEPASGAGGDWRGVDGVIRRGQFLGLEPPVGVQFKWLWGAPTLKSGQRGQVEESVAQAERLFSDIKHWVLITPHELSNADKERLDALGTGKSFGVHHRGQLQIEEWLHGHPALLARYYPDAARQHPEARGFEGGDFQAWARQYRSKVADDHRGLRLLGLPPRIAQHQEGDIPLRKVFVPQTFNPWGEREREPQSLVQLLQRERPCVLLGDPGSGKSTLLRFLALLHGGDAQLPGVAVADRIPLFISLREFRQRKETNFVDFLTDHAHERFQMQRVHPFFFESLLLMGEAVVLLDGLDEAGHVTTREQLARAIEAFHREYPTSPLYVTSRIVGYEGGARLSDERFDHFLVGRFDAEQQKTFIVNWYEAQLPTDARARTERVQSLTAAVERTPGVQRLASNPLLLTLMALIHHFHGRLPQSRGELYDMCVDMLLEHWQAVKAPNQPHPLRERGIYTEDAKKYLAALALSMQERNEQAEDEDARGLVPESALMAKLVDSRLKARRDDNEAAARDDVNAFMDYIRDRTGLLVYRGETEGEGQFAFAHLSFQEYLAAYQLAEDRSRTSDQHLQFFLDRVGRAAWEETLLMLLYRLSKSTSAELFPDMLVDAAVRCEEEARKPKLLRWFSKRNVLTTPEQRDACWLTLGRALRDELNFSDRDGREILSRLLDGWCRDPRFTGKHFQVLEEIALFSERRRGLLTEQLEEEWQHSPPARAIACLHLHAKLFKQLPPAAADKLRGRADLPALLPDLVAFHAEPGMADLLAERATLRQWTDAFRFLDSPDFYLLTLNWATLWRERHSERSEESRHCHPERSEGSEILRCAQNDNTSALAALALLWEKIAAELRLPRRLRRPSSGQRRSRAVPAVRRRARSAPVLHPRNAAVRPADASTC